MTIAQSLCSGCCLDINIMYIAMFDVTRRTFRDSTCSGGGECSGYAESCIIRGVIESHHVPGIGVLQKNHHLGDNELKYQKLVTSQNKYNTELRLGAQCIFQMRKDQD